MKDQRYNKKHNKPLKHSFDKSRPLHEMIHFLLDDLEQQRCLNPSMKPRNLRRRQRHILLRRHAKHLMNKTSL